MPGKVFTDPTAAAFLSSYEHLTRKEFPTAVTCSSLCPWFGTKPSGVSLNFLGLKTFPHLPLAQLCGSASGLHRGKQGWHWGLACVWAQVRAALAGLPGCGTGWGGCDPSPALAPTLLHKDTGSRVAPALLTLPHQVVSPSHSNMKIQLLLV